MFCYNKTLLTNKPTWVTRHSANAIDHIISNSVIGQNDFKSPIIKTNLSDHFLFSLHFYDKSFQKTEAKVKIKSDQRALGLLQVLHNHQKRNKDFMKYS